MVLDVELFRKQENPDAVGPKQLVESQQKRYKDVGVIQEIQDTDDAWRKAQFLLDWIRRLANEAAKISSARRKNQEKPVETEELPADLPSDLAQFPLERLQTLTLQQLTLFSRKLKEEEPLTKTRCTELQAKRDSLIRTVGNLLHPSVPVSDNEDNNGIERIIGKTGDANRLKYSHVDLSHMIGAVDTKRGVKVAGSRCYYLKGPGVALEQALVQFALHLLQDDGFTALSPPVFMEHEVMAEVAQLSQFAEELYKVTGKASERAEDAATSDKYLIATSEQPIAAFHRGEWLDPKDLPIKYVGISECFRQEVGSHGRDTSGIFRVHQFKKIEQFCITAPEDSWAMMDQMIANAERFCQQLGLPYRVVNIVSGALNLAAAKKLDLEAWFPGSGAFRELVSCSNCTDYQSRRLEIRFGRTKKMDARAEFVHMLNSTLCATTRVICCILENFQVGEYSEDPASNGGVVVPECLRPFMPKQFREFIPFVTGPLPVEEEAKEGGKAKAKAKAKE